MQVRTLLRTAEVAAMTGVPVGTLRYWRHRGEGPKSFRLGRRVAYFEDEVIAWVESQAAATSVGGAA